MSHQEQVIYSSALCVGQLGLQVVIKDERKEKKKTQILSVDMFLCMSVVLSKSQQRPFDI